ncbi:BatA domain-containing protein [Chondrinema litorale]|uniref:BatA domain-containing protein n=1 Tax=Chondrinema litorale TaxID=2994555 RepID=UPI002542B596|nr:BatA domain-containing protein [Chondrinema litorale]UZR94028.1 BatA domain-containing protein [Chondrinema litorale]
MKLLQPAYLLLLGSLLVPLAIHLWNRKKEKALQLGSVRFLMQLPRESVNSIQLNQKRLLALRCLILALIVFALANLVFSSSSEKENQVIVLIDKGLEKSAAIKTKLQEHINKGEKVLFTSWGLPEFDSESDYEAAISDKNLHFADANLMNVLLTEPVKPDSVVYYTKSGIRSFGKSLSALPFPINWMTVPSEDNTTAYVANVRQVNSDSLLFEIIESSEKGTSQKWIPVKKATEGNVAGISWEMQNDSVLFDSQTNLKISENELKVLFVKGEEETDKQQDMLNYFKAAFNSLSLYHYQQIEISTISSEQIKTDSLYSVDLLIWGLNTQVPQNIPEQKVLLLESTNTHTSLVNEFTDKPVRIMKKLYLNTAEGRPDVTIAEQLAKQVFQPSDFHTQQLNHADLRTLSQSQLKKFSMIQKAGINSEADNRQLESNTSIEYFLLIIAGLLILVERWVSVRNVL